MNEDVRKAYNILLETL